MEIPLRMRQTRIRHVRRESHKDSNVRFYPLASPETIKDWLLTSLKEKLIKIGAKVVGHARYVTFPMAEVGIAESLFADFLQMIADLRPKPDPAPA